MIYRNNWKKYIKSVYFYRVDFSKYLIQFQRHVLTNDTYEDMDHMNYNCRFLLQDVVAES